jgi:hypothetical protein
LDGGDGAGQSMNRNIRFSDRSTTKSHNIDHSAAGPARPTSNIDHDIDSGHFTSPPWKILLSHECIAVSPVDTFRELCLQELGSYSWNDFVSTKSQKV